MLQSFPNAWHTVVALNFRGTKHLVPQNNVLSGVDPSPCRFLIHYDAHNEVKWGFAAVILYNPLKLAQFRNLEQFDGNNTIQDFPCSHIHDQFWKLCENRKVIFTEVWLQSGITKRNCLERLLNRDQIYQLIRACPPLCQKQSREDSVWFSCTKKATLRVHL